MEVSGGAGGSLRVECSNLESVTAKLYYLNQQARREEETMATLDGPSRKLAKKSPRTRRPTILISTDKLIPDENSNEELQESDPSKKLIEEEETDQKI
jgi:hypothetical protein